MRGALVGGSADADDTGVVFVFSNQHWCTGVLIAPNAVLTSRVCVAGATGNLPGAMPFGATEPASGFQVVADQDAGSPSHVRGVAEIRVPATANDVYEGNLAVLVLDEPFAQSEALPFVPRFDPAAQQDEAFRLVGYGTTSAAGFDSGVRRELAGLQVSCVTGCGYDAPYDLHNWQGPAGLCGGDAGAPALDSQDRIIGVGFASADDCGAPSIFSTIAPWETFLTDAVVAAAALGCYEPPEWAGGSGTGAGGYGCGTGGGSGTGGSGTAGSSVGGAAGSGASAAALPEGDDEGCSCRTGRAADAGWPVSLLVGLALLARRRRQRG